jgi:hypothetical protein
MTFNKLYNILYTESATARKFYHGSMIYLPIGTILRPNINYEENWSATDFYTVLEKYRPKHALAHRNSVFMCDNEDDIDLSGGGTEYLFIVEPLGKVEKHDVNWSSEISMLISDGFKTDSHEVINAATNYWRGRLIIMNKYGNI